jgi:hypothetical protein
VWFRAMSHMTFYQSIHFLLLHNDYVNQEFSISSPRTERVDLLAAVSEHYHNESNDV